MGDRTCIQWSKYARHMTLSDLDTIEFAVAIPPTDNARVVLKSLECHPVICELRCRVKNGLLNKAQCSDFVESLVDDFKRGENFAHTYALIGLCAIFYKIDHRFCEDFLSELSNLSNTVEFGFAGRVAQAALKME